MQGWCACPDCILLSISSRPLNNIGRSFPVNIWIQRDCRSRLISSPIALFRTSAFIPSFAFFLHIFGFIFCSFLSPRSARSPSATPRPRVQTLSTPQLEPLHLTSLGTLFSLLINALLAYIALVFQRSFLIFLIFKVLLFPLIFGLFVLFFVLRLSSCFASLLCVFTTLSPVHWSFVAAASSFLRHRIRHPLS